MAFRAGARVFTGRGGMFGAGAIDVGTHRKGESREGQNGDCDGEEGVESSHRYWGRSNRDRVRYKLLDREEAAFRAAR